MFISLKLQSKSRKRQRFLIKSFSAWSKQWEGVFIQELVWAPAGPASLGDTHKLNKMVFCLLAGIFRQRSQLIGLLDKNSNICSAVLCHQCCQRRLQRKTQSNPPNHPAGWRYDRQRIVFYQHVMWSPWRHRRLGPTCGWPIWAFPHRQKSHRWGWATVAVLPKLQRLCAHPWDSQTGPTVRADPLLLDMQHRKVGVFLQFQC